MKQFNYNKEKNFIVILYFLLFSNKKDFYIQYIIKNIEVFNDIKHHENIIKYIVGKQILLNSQEFHFLSRVNNLNISNILKNESFMYFFKDYKKTI